MDERDRLAFEFARDTTNQLLTLSTGVVALTITFASDFVGGVSPWVRVLAVLSWACLLLSILFGLLTLLAWEAAVWLSGVPSYLVPGPVAIIAAFLADPAGLLLSLGSTLLVTFAALAAAAVVAATLAASPAPAGPLALRPRFVAARRRP